MPIDSSEHQIRDRTHAWNEPHTLPAHAVEFATHIRKIDFDPDERSASRVWLSVSPEDPLPESSHCRAQVEVGEKVRINTGRGVTNRGLPRQI